MFYYTPYIILPLLSAVVTGTLAFAVYRRRETATARYVFWIMIILAVWSLCYAVNTAALSLPVKILCYQVATTFVAFLGMATLALAMELLGYRACLTPGNVVLLAAVPVITVALVWTGEFHGLMRHGFFLYTSGPLLLLGFQVGRFWPVYVLYVQATLGIAVLFLLAGIVRGPDGYRFRFVVLASGVIAALAVELLDLTPIKGFRAITSILWFTGLCYAQAIYRHGLFKPAPAARAALFDQLDEPVLVFDNGGALADANRAARELFLAESKATDKNLEHRVFVRFPLLRSLSKDSGRDKIDSLARDAVDADRHWRLKTLPLTRGPFTVGTLVELHDITPMKRTEEELRNAHAAAEPASRAKSAFLANTSHEIRTPMNAIIGFTDLVLDSELTVEQRAYLDIVKVSSETLLQILNDIMDASKIEAGKMQIEDIDFDFRSLIEASLRPLSLRASSKNLKLESLIDPGIPDFVKGDPVRLKQILLNLLDNAIKFTDQGEVVLTVEMVTQDDAGRNGEGTAGLFFRFTVRDTGIGIAEEKQKDIFLSFTQADSSITRRYGGTGLGLSISSQLVKIMEGELTVQSSPGNGSSFSFTARFEKSTQTKGLSGRPVTAGALHPGSMNILLVEDSVINRTLTVHQLAKRGHRVTTANNGREALDRLEREVFDLVLMDDRMPVLDGCEATRIIRDRNSSVLRHDTPIIALSANVFLGDRKRFQEAGMDGCLPKPVRTEELTALVEMYASGQRPGPKRALQQNMDETLLPDSDRGEPARKTSDEHQDLRAEIRAAVLDRYAGDEQLVDELLLVFTQELPVIIVKIREACDAGDRALLELHAHSCKSAAASVGFGSLAAVAASVEHAAAANDMERAAGMMQLLEREALGFLDRDIGRGGNR